MELRDRYFDVASHIKKEQLMIKFDISVLGNYNKQMKFFRDILQLKLLFSSHRIQTNPVFMNTLNLDLSNKEKYKEVKDCLRTNFG